MLSVEALPSAPAGRAYHAWVRHGTLWTPLGEFAMRPDGTARVIAESPALASPPDQVEITTEPSGGVQVPRGPVVLSWPAG